MARFLSNDQAIANPVKGDRAKPLWTANELSEFERLHPEGLSVSQVIDLFVGRGERLTEATFRKYVQLGLLPRSVRVGRGQGRGSLGMYPANVVRQLDRVRRLMAQGFTIEDIQKQGLFLRGDIEALSSQLERVYGSLAAALRAPEVLTQPDPLLGRALEEARKVGLELLGKLQSIEERMSMRARMARAAV